MNVYGECVLCNIDPLYIHPLNSLEHSMQWIKSIARYSRFNDISWAKSEEIFYKKSRFVHNFSFNSAEILDLMQKLLWAA